MPSTTKTHKTALVIIPPESVWPAIEAIRRRHDPHVLRWMPHVTLLYPFRTKERFEAELSVFFDACRRIVPFEIELTGFHAFEHSEHVSTLWLAPQPAGGLVDLQTAMWRLASDCDDVRRFAGGFIPHLSVGQARGGEETRCLITELQSSWTPLRFVVSEVSLIWRNDPPDDVFRQGQRVPLAATMPAVLPDGRVI